MVNLSNTISFLRFPLAFLFLSESPFYRCTAVIVAMLTDVIDGYLARKSKNTTRFGAFLDPTMDKFFVIFCITILYLENKLELWQILAMVSRDFCLCIFCIYLLASKLWKNYTVRNILWGKVITSLQFVVLFTLSMGYSVAWYCFIPFIIFGSFFLIELFQSKETIPTQLS